MSKLENPEMEIQVEDTEVYVDVFLKSEIIQINDRTVPRTIQLTFKQAKELAFIIRKNVK